MPAVTLEWGVNPGSLNATANRAQVFNCPSRAHAVTVWCSADAKFFYGATGVAQDEDVSTGDNTAKFFPIPANTLVTLDVTRDEFGHPGSFALASASSAPTYKVAPHAKGL